MKNRTVEALDNVGAIDHSMPENVSPWVNAPLDVVLDKAGSELKSKPRAVTYAFGASIIATVAFYAGWEAQETAVWVGVLATSVPFAGLVVSALKTWPRRSG